MGSLPVLIQAFEAVRTFSLSRGPGGQPACAYAAAASEGKYEVFSTTPQFDGAAQHLQWLG